MTEEFKKEYTALKRELFDIKYSFLNDMQRRSVYKINGPLLILAGAGSGKTTVLVNRLAYMVKYGDAYLTDYVPTDADAATLEEMRRARSLRGAALDEFLTRFSISPPAPWRVMAITFTNKAANEIKDRISKAFDGDTSFSSDIWSGTFHSICMRFLRRYADVLGYPRDFGICDADDAKKLATDCMKDLKIDSKQFPVKGILRAISSEKDKLHTPAECRESAGGDAYLKTVSAVYSLYQKRLAASSLMDFDDIIMQTVALFEDNPDILSEVQNRFRYISIDEYQDTNEAQFRLVTLLAGGYKNIMVVGDDDQSIYKFRGATIKNIMNFDTVYPNAEVIKLEQNYRSTKTILDAANAVIKNNSERRGKNLWTDRGSGEAISVSKLSNQLEEARFISDKISKMKSSGSYDYRDVAVLYRTNAQSRSIEQAFAKAGIPYRMLGSLRFFDRQEIKDILAYISVVNNPSDSLRLKRIINVPRRGIGDKSIEAAEIIADSGGVTLLEVMRHAESHKAIPTSAAKNMESLAKLIDSAREKNLSVSALIEEISVSTGYMTMLIRAGESEKDRIENIGELISTARQYEDSNPNADLSGFLEDVALVSDVDRYDESANAVVLMTIHSAKGLEFPVVFLPGMEEGLFPGIQSIINPSEIEEERRLAYVAITRAKKELYITSAYERMINGSTQYNRLSRFVNEIPSELCRVDGIGSQAGGFGLASSLGDSARFKTSYGKGAGGYEREDRKYTYNGHNGYNGASPRKNAVQRTTTARGAQSAIIKYDVGDRVRHSTFGEGSVVSAKPMGQDILYEINFDRVGVKKLMATYARLTKI